MSLCFFADHCVPMSVIRALRDAGHDVRVLKDHIPQDADDVDVIEFARSLDAVLISYDSDFTDISTYPPSRYCGIVSLQVRNHPEITPAIIQRFILYVADNPEPSDFQGKLILVEPHRIRIRE